MDFFVGTYSVSIAGMAAGGEGMYRVRFDTDTGAFDPLVLAVKCINPSALVASPSGTYIFAVREVFGDQNPALQSFQANCSGGLTKVSDVPITSELPCHIAFDPVQSRVASAQYWSGDVAICAATNGVLHAPQKIVHTGTGLNAARQEGPHPHFVMFTDNGSVLHVVDLGLDKIACYRLDGQGNVTQESWLTLPAGCGPRHMAVAQNAQRAWVVCELDECLIAIKRSGLGWAISSIQNGFAPPKGIDGSAAAIRLSPDERHVYISGRRQSQIAGFSCDGSSIGAFESGGQTPREFVITPDGRWIISANQDSNTLTSLARDPDTGALTLTGHTCAIASPVALVPAPQMKA